MGANVTNLVLAFSAVAANLIGFGGLWLNWKRMSASERTGAAENAANRMVEHGDHGVNHAVELAHAVHHGEPEHHPDTGTADGAKP